MARSRYTEDLAYGEVPQRWDRDRFERFGRGPPPGRYEEDIRITESDRGPRRDFTLTIDERGPGRERERFFEEDRYTSRPRRRTDRELFGDVDPREIANMALTPYLRKSTSREEINVERRGSLPRPGLLRRQSSLDVFDRKPGRYYERDEYRVPPYVPVPLPYYRRGDEFEDIRYRENYGRPEAYREVEIQRERSVHRNKAKSEAPSESGRSRKSKAKTVKSKSKASSSSSSSSSSEEEILEIKETIKEDSIHESIVDTVKKFKKGKTRMPKRLVRREAIMDLGYPFDEEEDFFVLRIALEKEQIDEVIKISESYRDGDKAEKVVYAYEDKIEEKATGEREEVVRTEWLNPPSVYGKSERSRSRRAPSPSNRSTTTRRTSPARTERTRARSRRASSPTTIIEKRETIIEESRPLAPPVPPSLHFHEEDRAIIEERSPSGALVIREREYRSDRDLDAEIRALESERRALRLERDADEKRELVLRTRGRDDDDLALVAFRSRSRPAREVLEVYERERSPPRNVVRVEKDRKARRQARIVAAAMATLT
ncbi:Hypothetical protein R9X50_00220100 [Acrodontium crateriforme]|uniref:DUF8035 domain-containing protein n=1 Tax=Acrodontium crateriforme TaxID=150365 RepID=A0AAQ3M122_9PEZI|nr:Hypothetical protein R9X50_00220100 [Acrodontium crateriforme]